MLSSMVYKVEVGGMTVQDPKLGHVLGKLWAALEKREQSKR